MSTSKYSLLFTVKCFAIWGRSQIQLPSLSTSILGLSFHVFKWHSLFTVSQELKISLSFLFFSLPIFSQTQTILGHLLMGHPSVSIPVHFSLLWTCSSGLFSLKFFRHPFIIHSFYPFNPSQNYISRASILSLSVFLIDQISDP